MMKAKTFLEPPVNVGKPYLAGPIGKQRWYITIDKKPVKQSRFLVEQKIGRKLEPHEVVHHINHNRLDDRIDNLEITNNFEHGNYHNPTIIKPCANCGKMVKKKPSRIKKAKNNFCSNACIGIFRYKNTPVIPCSFCGKMIKVILFRIHRDKNHFCDKTCKFSFKSKKSHVSES